MVVDSDVGLLLSAAVVCLRVCLSAMCACLCESNCLPIPFLPPRALLVAVCICGVGKSGVLTGRTGAVVYCGEGGCVL